MISIYTSLVKDKFNDSCYANFGFFLIIEFVDLPDQR